MLGTNPDVGESFEKELAAMLERIPLQAQSVEREHELLETYTLLEELEELGYVGDE